MELIRAMVRDLAIIAIIAAFIELFLPGEKMRYPVKLIFGLYFMAILVNPILSLFNNTHLTELDFRDMEINIEAREPQIDESGDILSLAETSLGQEMAAKCHALYEDCKFEVTVRLGESDIDQVTVKVRGLSPPLEAIREYLASTYGVEKSKIDFVLEEE